MLEWSLSLSTFNKPLCTCEASFDIWHWRLGHSATNRSSSISALVLEVSFSNKRICDVYSLGEHT